MKKIIFAVSFIVVWFGTLKAQEADTVSIKIANRMQDVLGLTIPQKQNITGINIQLQSEKRDARLQYNSRDSVGMNIQRIENKRDSLYKKVLTEKQYTYYLENKRDIIKAR